MTWCWLFHRWGPWSVPEAWYVTWVWSESRHVAYYQKRTCRACGKVEERSIG